ncbi:MAG: hypothetical protein ACJAXA_000323 [Candidatus Aldehydirespiratoraceae bacterium]|jgi:hypothetical protein
MLGLESADVAGFVDDRVDPVHSRDLEPGAAGNHLQQECVEPTARLALQPAQVAVLLRQQLRHSGVIIRAHHGEIVCSERSDRDRVGIVGVVLLGLARAQHTHSRSAYWWHIDSGLSSEQVSRSVDSIKVGSHFDHSDTATPRSVPTLMNRSSLTIRPAHHARSALAGCGSHQRTHHISTLIAMEFPPAHYDSHDPS